MNAIIDLVERQKSQTIEVYIPKSTQKYFSERQDIAIDYAYLAYSGQLLYNISEEFSFEEVPPEDHESILFTVKVSNTKKLGQVLQAISFGYVNEHEDEEFIFDDDVEDFLSQVETNQISPACQYFIDMYKEYITP